jgi:DNA ligase (NAD+)
LLGKLNHFVSKNAANVDGLSEQTLAKFIELGWLSSFEDIYKLKDHYETMVNLEGFGEKSVEKLLDSIEKSRTITLDKFIYALSIPDVGRSTAKTIASRFENFRDFIVRALDFDWCELDGIGIRTATKIDEFICNYIYEIRSLAEELEFEEVEEVVTSSNLTGKTFVITGSLNHFANRDEAKEKIEMLGGKVSGSVSAKTSYLVNNDVNSTSGKNKKAKELGVEIISEDELIEMMNR